MGNVLGRRRLAPLPLACMLRFAVHNCQMKLMVFWLLDGECTLGLPSGMGMAVLGALCAVC